MKKQEYAKIEEGFFNFVTDYVNQPKVDTVQPKIDAIKSYLVPKGFIGIWSGAANAIPAGWALCDGTNGTPDLRGRFVLGGIAGTGTNSIGNKGGVSELTLQPYHLPEHTHSGTTSTTGNHSHSGDTGVGRANGEIRSTHAAGGNIASNHIPGFAPSNFHPTGHGGSDFVGASHFHSFSTNTTGNHNHTLTTNTGDQPTKGQSFNILPPYFALAYIMKL
jgi:microcystin-dependent protein